MHLLDGVLAARDAGDARLGEDNRRRLAHAAAPLVTPPLSPHGRASAHTSGKIDEVYRSAELARQGAVQCPGKGSKPCKEFVVPAVAHASFPQRCACPKGHPPFCASCRQPYHYRTGCAEALRVNARWVKWLQSELGDFLVEAVKHDPDRYSSVLKEHCKGKSALDEARHLAISRSRGLAVLPGVFGRGLAVFLGPLAKKKVRRQ